MSTVPSRLRHALDFVRRLDLRNVRMLTNTLAIVARPSLRNYWYNREFVRNELPGAVANMVFEPDDMNDFQRHSPVAAYTSSPEDGLLAGFTEHGRLSALFYPHTAFTQQIPYFETGDDHLFGSKPREGAFFGVGSGDDVTWLWEESVGHDVSPRLGTGVVEFEYDAPGAGVEATEIAYVLSGEEVLARDLVVRNVGSSRVGSVYYYTQANVNDERQYPPGVTHRNKAVAGDELRWTDCESDLSLRVLPDDDGAVRRSGVAEAPLSELFAAGSPAATGHYLGGYLEFAVDLEPGEETTVSVFTTGRDDLEPGVGALEGAAPDRQRRTEAAWAEHLADVDLQGIDDRHADQYEHSVVGLLMLYDPDSGSISAAPSVQPAYYPSWPRDGAFAAMALARAGKEEVAADYLGRFLADAQEEDGAFEQCYDSTGGSAGVIPRSNDQQAIFVAAVREVYRVTGDESFLAEVWPAVENALEYTVESIVDNGLLRATHDFAEMWVHARQSLWTNAFAYRALADGAALAEELGESAERYERAVETVGDAIDDQFFEAAEDLLTSYTITGGEHLEQTIFSAAIFPTGWAHAYDRLEVLREHVDGAYAGNEEHWLPSEFLYAGTLYHLGDVEAGDEVVADLAGETIPGGTLAEVVDGDDHSFAALGWSNASFLLALQERAQAVSE